MDRVRGAIRALPCACPRAGGHMKDTWARCACVLCFAASVHGEDPLDRLGEKLTFSAWNDHVRARVSGALDLEYFHSSDPPFGLFDSSASNLYNPRLTL